MELEPGSARVFSSLFIHMEVFLSYGAWTSDPVHRHPGRVKKKRQVSRSDRVILLPSLGTSCFPFKRGQFGLEQP